MLFVERKHTAYAPVNPSRVGQKSCTGPVLDLCTGVKSIFSLTYAHLNFCSHDHFGNGSFFILTPIFSLRQEDMLCTICYFPVYKLWVIQAASRKNTIPQKGQSGVLVLLFVENKVTNEYREFSPPFCKFSLVVSLQHWKLFLQSLSMGCLNCSHWLVVIHYPWCVTDHLSHMILFLFPNWMMESF